MTYQLEHHDVQMPDRDGTPIRLHVVQAGPVAGPLLILLHGFPEFWYGWKNQILPLAERGFRVWAPDQRGYNLSDKPVGVGAYGLDTLAADVLGLIDVSGRSRAIVVGHDWGAAVAWWLAATYPERVERLVVLNVPHPAVMKRYVSRDPGQLRRSWYIAFFQLPFLPERLMRADNFALLVRTLRSSSRRGTFSDDDLMQYRAAWSQPGSTSPDALTSMLNWYRAALRYPAKGRSDKRITVPALLIWGVRDAFLKVEMAQPSIDLCDNGRLVLLEKATHWVQHEEAPQVTELIANG